MTDNPLAPEIRHALDAMRKSLSQRQEQSFITAAATFPANTRALCELLHFTGCRIGEAIALRRTCIDAEESCVVFQTLKQRGKIIYRAVPVPHSLIVKLLALSTSADGRFWPYSRWTALRRIKQVMLLAGITGPLANTKPFRHGYNKKSIYVGLPQRIRCSLLGHQTTRANDCYGQLIGGDLRPFAEQIWANGS